MHLFFLISINVHALLCVILQALYLLFDLEMVIFAMS